LELIYLYIENYKNIKKQGFNFSPRFKCRFEDGVLSIDKNKNYKSIFPENISVTAIVGKNGSGKSSILEVIGNNNLIIKKQINAFIIFFHDGEFLKVSSIDFKWNIELKTIENKILEKNILYLNFSHFINLKTQINLITLANFTPDYIDSGIDFDGDDIFFDKTFKILNFILLSNLDLYEKIFNFMNYPKIKYLKLGINRNNNYFDEKESVENILYKIYGYIDTYESKEKLLESIKNLKNTLNKKEIKNIKNVSKLINKHTVELNNQNIKIINDFYSMLLSKDVELLNFFKVEFLDNNKQQIHLSNGEIVLFIYYYFICKYNNPIIIIDEIDLYLHPDIIRKIIYIFVNCISGSNIFKNIILTTHSPFILSDIPKENIIFLKDGENVSDEVGIDTFGANIHTLLSHGFFMEDGLMGEFAKKRINEVIKFLNDKDSEIKDKDEAKNIINLIGEPIIKNQLQKMLDSKRLDKIDEIEKEIELLKHRLEILRKN